MSSSVRLCPFTAGPSYWPWDKSSKSWLVVGEMTSGLLSQDSVLCSEVAMVVVVLLGTGSKSSSSSRMGDSWMSGRGEGGVKFVVWTPGEQFPDSVGSRDLKNPAKLLACKLEVVCNFLQLGLVELRSFLDF